MWARSVGLADLSGQSHFLMANSTDDNRTSSKMTCSAADVLTIRPVFRFVHNLFSLQFMAGCLEVIHFSLQQVPYGSCECWSLVCDL